MTSNKFLNIYHQICKPNTTIHLKTDSKELFDFTLQALKDKNITPVEAVNDLYNSNILQDHQGITTKFEQKALDKNGKIYYIKFLLSI